MGQRGPRKTPTKILADHDSWRAKERKDEPGRLLGDFSCPKDLVGEGKKFWMKLMPDLVKIGVISKTELDIFKMLCETWADYRRAVKENSGDYKLKKSLREEVIRYASHFGLTPSTRSDVKAFDSITDVGSKDRYFKAS